MSKGVGFSHWDKSGMLSREAEWFELAAKSYNLKVITYDTPERCQPYKAIYHGLRFLPIPRLLDNKAGHWLFSIFCCLFYFRDFLEADTIRSNQQLGSWGIIIPSLIWRKSKNYTCRSGYSLIEFRQRMGQKKFTVLFYKLLLDLTHRVCTKIIVACESDKNFIASRDRRKVVVIENYISTNFLDVGSPVQTLQRKFLWSGRLVEQKSIIELADYFSKNPEVGTLTIVGDGPLRAKIEAISDRSINVTLHGALRQSEIIDLAKDHSFAVFPSNYEGNPKVLKEMISLGLCVLYRNRPGVSEVFVEHGFYGRSFENLHEISSLVSDILLKDDILGKLKSNQVEAKKLFQCEAYVKNEFRDYNGST